MANKTLSTRIQLKYDSYSNWTTNNPVLLAGELAIATVPTGDANNVSTSLPAVLIKIGDGTHKYNELDFIQAKSADVHAWAKAATKPAYAASEITGLSDYISEEIQDTDTQYQIVKVDDYKYKLQSKALGGDWADVANSTIVIPNDTAAIEALQALVGNTAVATQITNAIAALDLANTYEAKGAAAEVKTQVIGTDADTAASDTIKGAKKYADSLDAAMDTRVDALEAAIGEGGSVGTQIDAKINALDVTDTAVDGKYVSSVSEVDGKIKVTRENLPDYSETYDAKGAAAQALADAKTYADGLNTAMDTRMDAAEASITTLNGEDTVAGSVAAKIKTAIEKLDATAVTAGTGEIISSVSEADGVVSVSKRPLEAADIPELAISKITGLQTALDGKQDNLEFESAYDASTNKVATMADVTGAVAGLSGAMHFEGVKAEIPTDNTGYESGDVILVGNKEYVFDGSTWHELGDETIYAVKGSIVNADIADNAAIAQSKIAGLTDDLDAKANTTDLGTMAAESKDDYVTKAAATGYDDILTKTSAASTYVAQESGKRLMTDTEGTKLAGVAEGAQVNVIETVKVNGVALTPDAAKAVDVTVPTGALASKDKVAEADLATDLATKINAKAERSDLDALDTYVGTIPDTASASNVVAYVDEKVAGEGVAALKTRVDNAETDIDNLQSDVTTLKGADTVEGSVAKALKDAKAYTDVLANGAVATNTAAIATLNGTGEGSVAKAVSDGIAALDVEDAAVEHQVVTSVSEADGKISVTRAQLSTDDINAGTEVWIFDCGSSSTVI